MAYKAFSLKWRPQSFDEVVGQEHAITTLKNAILKNRLTHAYIFAGPRGVGKTSVARILAKSLNCKDGPTPSPCQKCPSCVEITQGRSLDVLEIDGASNRGIDEIRVLRENVKFAPVAGRFKIYIIDEVHMLTTEAFNALLKTLEEPPEFVKFIFATTQAQKVIPTILSRCHRFDFVRIPVLKIIAQLEKIAGKEKIETDKEVLFAIAKASDGSLRDAESILDQLISFSPDRISAVDVHAVLGIVEQDSLFGITDHIIQKDSVATIKLLNEIIDQGKDVNVFLHNLIEHFRNIMVGKVTKQNSNLIDLPQDFLEKLRQQAESFSLEEIFSTFNLLVNTQEVSKRFGSVRIPLEIALVKLAQDKRKSPASNQAPIIHRVNSPATEKPAKDPQGQPLKNIENTTTVTLSQIKEVWSSIVENLGRTKMSLATYLHEGELLKLEANVLTVGFARNDSLHKEVLEAKDNRLLIESIINEILNADIKLSLFLTDEVKKEAPRSSAALKQALDTFGGRLIKEE